jgi:hypothetical protein
MRRIHVVLAVVMACALVTVGLASASRSEDPHSQNMRLVSSNNFNAQTYSGTDLAFWDNYMIAGNMSPGGFRILDISNPAATTVVGNFVCRGSQSDVSIWDTLVFVSVDASQPSSACSGSGTAWEGIRVVSIADPANPTQVAAVRTDCGSHTHTLVPDLANNRILLYVLSYPLGENTATCGQDRHEISIVEVPLANPAGASVIATPDVGPTAAIGCHDVTVLLEKKIAGAACISESQVWDIANPASPQILARIHNPAINIHHSTTFSWDGNTLVLGDELGGAAVAPGCVVPSELATTGALWFYDITNRALPIVKSHYHIPQQDTGSVCSAHNFNTLPTSSARDVLTSAWYSGATTIVDFTDPAAPTQIGYYIPKDNGAANSWSTYWYRDYMYGNNRNVRGVDVFALDDAGLVGDAIQLPRMNQSTMESFASPTAASVRSLRSAKTVLGAVIHWRTASETQLAGFNLYRTRNGKLVRLNRALIPALAAGKASGQSYRFADRLGRFGTTYHLQVVALDGKKTWFGTTTVRQGN